MKKDNSAAEENNNYGDYECKSCGNTWRRYGNGGLVFGAIDHCPDCGSSRVKLTMSNGTVWE